ncbi:MAG: cytochrome c3 family protein [Chitinophagales bacterium]
MNPTPVKRWLLCAGFILFLLYPAVSLAAGGAPGVRPEVERAAGKCALCHTPMLSYWQRLAHGGTRRGDAGQAVNSKPLACTACHPSGVLRGKPVAASEAPTVCGRCHLKEAEPGGIVLNASDWKASGHAKSGTYCLQCHSVHRPGDTPLLKESSDSLCLSCHATGRKCASAVPGIETSKNCVSCHDPHGGKRGGLYSAKAGGEAWQLKKAVTHKPVAEGKCGACHEVHKVFPSQAASLDAEEDEGGPVGGASAVGPNRSLLAKPPVTICYECHGEMREQFLKSRHVLAGQRAKLPVENPCAACHLPHGSDYAHLTIYEGSRLCLTCHPDKTPHHFLTSARVSQSKIECLECHNPHGTPYPSLLVLDRTQICARCHKK